MGLTVPTMRRPSTGVSRACTCRQCGAPDDGGHACAYCLTPREQAGQELAEVTTLSDEFRRHVPVMQDERFRC